MPIYRIDNNKVIPIERVFSNPEMSFGASALKTGLFVFRKAERGIRQAAKKGIKTK